MFKIDEYIALLEEFKKVTDAEYAEDHKDYNDNEGCGFAWDGPIDPQKWNNNNLKILFLAKEAPGADGSDKFEIMGSLNKFPDRYKDRPAGERAARRARRHPRSRGDW